MTHPDSPQIETKVTLVIKDAALNRWIRNTRTGINRILNSSGNYGNTLKLNAPTAQEIGCDFVRITKNGLYTTTGMQIYTREMIEEIMLSLSSTT